MLCAPFLPRNPLKPPPCHAVCSLPALPCSPRGRALVDAGYLMMDSLIGYTLLGVLAILSLVGVVAWLQVRGGIEAEQHMTPVCYTPDHP